MTLPNRGDVWQHRCGVKQCCANAGLSNARASPCFAYALRYQALPRRCHASLSRSCAVRFLCGSRPCFAVASLSMLCPRGPGPCFASASLSVPLQRKSEHCPCCTSRSYAAAMPRHAHACLRVADHLALPCFAETNITVTSQTVASRCFAFTRMRVALPLRCPALLQHTTLCSAHAQRRIAQPMRCDCVEMPCCADALPPSLGRTEPWLCSTGLRPRIVSLCFALAIRNRAMTPPSRDGPRRRLAQQSPTVLRRR
jgi:hypothetical protein